MTWLNSDTQCCKHKVEKETKGPTSSGADSCWDRCEVFCDKPWNVGTGSYYAAGVLNRLEASFLKEEDNPLLMAELGMLWFLINHRHHGYYAMHTRSRTALPGPLAEGNRRADAQAVLLSVPEALQQAK